MRWLKRWINAEEEELRGDGLSIIIPFRGSNKYRRQDRNFRWVLQYWRCMFPGAEIIVGRDKYWSLPFSKTTAVNDGVRRSHGDILVITDADCYISDDTVLQCTEEIRKARSEGNKLWYVPYRQFYRLTDEASLRVLDSDPCCPYRIPEPPDWCDVQNRSGSGRGHWYGAMIQIMPRECFDEVGCWDERFRGWGGEDHSAMRAADTLYCRHSTCPGQVLHLWHPMVNVSGIHDWVNWNERLWDNQLKSQSNGQLAARYSRAFGDKKRMRRLLDESKEFTIPLRIWMRAIIILIRSKLVDKE